MVDGLEARAAWVEFEVVCLGHRIDRGWVFVAQLGCDFVADVSTDAAGNDGVCDEVAGLGACANFWAYSFESTKCRLIAGQCHEHL